MSSIRFLSLIILLVIFGAPNPVHASINFMPGDYYMSANDSNTITEYNQSGAITGTLTLPSTLGSGVRGLAFGPDNLLYAAIARGSNGFAVLALDSSGTVHQTYTGSAYVAGGVDEGKITIAGGYLYVSGQDSLTRYLLGNPASGSVIYSNNQVEDSIALPNGNLLVASAYQIQEITRDGALVRNIPLTGGNASFNDIRAIEFNAATNDLFVTELGNSDLSFQLLRFDATTGMLEANTFLHYGMDLFLTNSGKILTGSWLNPPRLFDQNLNDLGTVGQITETFVTQLVPEPSTWLLISIGALIVSRRSLRS